MIQTQTLPSLVSLPLNSGANSYLKTILLISTLGLASCGDNQSEREPYDYGVNTAIAHRLNEVDSSGELIDENTPHPVAETFGLVMRVNISDVGLSNATVPASEE